MSNCSTTLPCRMSCSGLREAAKKVFLVAQPLRPYPPPIELSGHIFFQNYFFELQKKLSFLSDPAFNPPPLLVAGPKNKKKISASLSLPLGRGMNELSLSMNYGEGRG